MRRKLQNTIQTLIRNWLNGDSTAHQTLRQKRSDNDDPFLKDALDGYELINDNHAERLSRLDARLQKRIGAKKENRVVILMQRVAAIAAILLMVSGSFWWFNSSFDTDAPIVFNDTETASISTLEEEIETETNSVIEEELISKPEPNVLAKNKVVKKKRNKTVKREQSAEKPITIIEELAPEELVNTTEAAETEFIEEVILSGNNENQSDKILYNEPVEYASAPAVVYESAETEVVLEPAVEYYDDVVMSTQMPVQNAPLVSINGLVLDGEGEPIFGATIAELDTENGTITDFDGRFELKLTAPSNKILISYIGFTDIIQTPMIDSLNLFTLEQSAVLQEVTITGLAVEKSDSVFQYLDTDISIYPKDGLEKYEEYLNDQLLYPQSAAAKKVEGVVKLRFEIDAKGQPQNIEIQESVGYGCDEEAVRLLKEGPVWETKEGEKKTRLAIPFKLKRNKDKTKKDGN